MHAKSVCKDFEIKKLREYHDFYGWTMSQNLPVNNFEWIKDTSQLNEDFFKNFNEENDKDIFWKLMFNIIIYHFYHRE